MTNREPRQAILLPARMRAGSAWTEVAIYNVSPHGMLLHAIRAPRPGTYLEIRRATMTIIARTVWAKGHFFGICTQDVVDARALAAGRSVIGAAATGPWNGSERRTAGRPDIAEQYNASRYRASMAQFAMITTGIAMTAIWCALQVLPTINHNAAIITSALATAG